jgi:hypothetical protein
MNLKLKDNMIQVDLWDLLENLTDLDVDRVVNTLACQERVIEEVASQIIYRSTSDGSCGEECSNVFLCNITALQKARKDVAANASEISFDVIGRMDREYQRCEEERRMMYYYIMELKLWESFCNYRKEQEAKS